jgi:molybdopterin synthase sulfur carrier subunit
MIRVRIPPALRTETDGSREVEIAGETVGDVLDALVQAFPGLDGRLLRDGAIQPFLTVYLDGTDVRGLEGSATHVQPGSTLLLLPAMAGGSQMSHGKLTPRVSLPRRRTATRRGRRRAARQGPDRLVVHELDLERFLRRTKLSTESIATPVLFRLLVASARP